MSKPKIIHTLLSQVSEQLKELKKEHAATMSEKQRIESEMQRLNDMPVCREDFALLLRENLAIQAKPFGKALVNALMYQENGTYRDDGSTIREPIVAANKRGFHELANPHAFLLGGWMFDHSPFSRLNRDGETLKALLWLFPEQIHARIMQTIDEEIGEKWGNDDLPRIAQRRGTLADLASQHTALSEKLAELDGEIAEITNFPAQAT